VKLSDALHSVERLAFDSAALIYFIERQSVHYERMLLIMRMIDNGIISGVSATLTLTEVLVHPIRAGNRELIDRYEAVLSNSRHFRLVPVTTAIARRAADLRATHNLRTPDALHIAAAIEADCDAFLTNDKSLLRVNTFRILVLEELDITSSDDG
jgi:predicted nucleic acid-binding protein